ncbi:MAG: DNA gyrase inhibitor YacG [Proteobacteria bacterium]|nr:DNA gyrase inhibitor YacG [Pseudomonadota bacterium]
MKVVCPICKRETHWRRNPTRPFCSERCKLIDLGSWIGGEYVIPARPVNRSSPDEDQDGEGESTG